MRGAALVAMLVTVTACRRGAAEVRRQHWEGDRRSLEEQLERLEERMLADQARVHFWAEMRERHESVSALACANLGRHVESMAVLADRQREKGAALAKKRRVAARLVPAAGRGR